MSRERDFLDMACPSQDHPLLVLGYWLERAREFLANYLDGHEGAEALLRRSLRELAEARTRCGL